MNNSQAIVRILIIAGVVVGGLFALDLGGPSGEDLENSYKQATAKIDELVLVL